MLLYQQISGVITRRGGHGQEVVLAGLLLVGMAAAVDPLRVYADGEPLASLTPQMTQRVTAPVISGRNPEV